MAQFAQQVVERPVQDELSSSFMIHAVSTLLSRAIPDLRDGLKPAQRRILWTAQRHGYLADRPHVKSMEIVGKTMADHHPHGDASTYEALVRMEHQQLNQVPLIDGQGGFADCDDKASAARYTEARLSAAAQILMEGLNEDGAPMGESYNGKPEPLFLPGPLPLLLLNGTAGIAVGKSTNFLPYNPTEILEACLLLLRDPKATDQQLAELVPGPDSPEGGWLLTDGSEIDQIATTGRGKVRMQARVRIQNSPDGPQLLFDQLPYGVGPGGVCEQIREAQQGGAKRDKRPELTDVLDAQDMTDMHRGVLLVITCRPEADPAQVLRQLWFRTQLQVSFPVQQNCLWQGRPVQLGTWDILRNWLQSQQQTWGNRLEFRQQRAEQARRTAEILIKAAVSINQVIRVLQKSKTEPQARQELAQLLHIQPEECDPILEMRLRRLIGLERDALVITEREQAAIVKECQRLLGDPRALRTEIASQLKRVQQQVAKPRRTVISGQPQQLVIRDTAGTAALDRDGTVRVVWDSAALPGVHTSLCAVTETDLIWILDSQSRPWPLRAVDGAEHGRAATQIAPNSGPAKALFTVPRAGSSLVMVTRQGQAARVQPDRLDRLKPGQPLVSLDPGDQIVTAMVVPDSTPLVAVTSAGQVLRLTSAADIPARGPGAGTVALIKLPPAAQVVGAGPAADNTLIWAKEQGKDRAATVEAKHFSPQGRGGQGRKFPGLDHIETATVGARGEIGTLDPTGHLNVLRQGHKLRPARAVCGLARGDQP
jgi:DNA gyrase subunit A